MLGSIDLGSPRPFALAKVFLAAILSVCFTAFAAGEVHGLWVWKTSSVLEAPQGAENLRDFCQSQGINEVYVSISTRDADAAGKHRDKLLDHVRGVLAFNQNHTKNQFDGIHLDIEPQQRPENKGAGN